VATSETDLEKARRHVRTGLQVVARQRDLIERLHWLKLNSASAERLLGEFERSQAIFEDDLQRFDARASNSK
jgi:hypothetical protein